MIVRNYQRMGCAAGLVLVVGFAALVWWGVQTRLKLWITSTPQGAQVKIGPSSTTYTTPARVSMLFPPIQNNEWLYAHAVSGSHETRGRIIAWDAGFKGGFTAFIDKVESMDGAAWVCSVLPGPRQISIHFPVPGKFAFAYQFWNTNEFTVNDRFVEIDDRGGVQFLAVGANRIETELWSAEIDVDEGYCVQFFEWGGAGPERLLVSFEMDQISSGSLVLDSTEIPIEDFEQHPARSASTCRLKIEGNDGSKCDVSIKFVRPDYPFFALRVTSSR